MKKIRFSNYCLMLAFFFCLAGCDSKNTTHSQGRPNWVDSTTLNPPSYKRYDIEGISLDLPSGPREPRILQTSPKLADIIKRQAGYDIDGVNCAILVFHVEQAPQCPANLKFAVDGALENMQKVPGITDFTSHLTNQFPKAGLNTSEIVAQFKHNGTPKVTHIFVVAKDNHLYEVSIEGEANAVEECSSRIFSSIEVNGTPSINIINIAGLKLALPGLPQKAEFGLSKIAKANTESQNSYVVQNGSTQFAICQTIHHAMNGSLEDIVHGIVGAHEKYSVVYFRIAGVSGKRVTMELALEQSIQHVSIVVFSKDKALWQVYTIDPSLTKAHAAMDALIPTISIEE